MVLKDFRMLDSRDADVLKDKLMILPVRLVNVATLEAVADRVWSTALIPESVATLDNAAEMTWLGRFMLVATEP